MILYIWFFLFDIRNKTANSCKCVFQKNPSWNCIYLNPFRSEFLIRSEWFKIFSSLSIVDTQCYITFRCTAEWFDNSRRYAVLTSVAIVCDNTSPLKYHPLYSLCYAFYPCDLFWSKWFKPKHVRSDLPSIPSSFCHLVVHLEDTAVKTLNMVTSPSPHPGFQTFLRKQLERQNRSSVQPMTLLLPRKYFVSLFVCFDIVVTLLAQIFSFIHLLISSRVF